MKLTVLQENLKNAENFENNDELLNTIILPVKSSFFYYERNQILSDIKSSDKPTLMIFNKIDAYQHEVIAEDDLTTERTRKHYTLEEWKQTWMSHLGEDHTIFISATEKANFEEFREKVYEAVRKIHITRFPYNKFLYPDYKDAVEND